MHPRGGASLIFVNPLAPCRSNFCLLYVFLLPGFCHTSRPTVLFAKKLHAGVVCCLHQRNSRNLFRNESRVTEPDFGGPILLDPAFHGKTGRPSETLARFAPFKSNLWRRTQYGGIVAALASDRAGPFGHGRPEQSFEREGTRQVQGGAQAVRCRSIPTSRPYTTHILAIIRRLNRRL
jgi:hypothetical protein